MKYIIHKVKAVNRNLWIRLFLTSVAIFMIPIVVCGQESNTVPQRSYKDGNVITDNVDSSTIKHLNYQLVNNFFKLPPGITFGEAAGVAIDERGHIYVLNRGTDPLIEFTEKGNYVQTLAKGIVGSAHGLRIDRYGKIWITDVANHTVLQLDKGGHVILVLGRKGYADETDTFFNQPTDIAFGPNDEIFITDGYGNSRIVKLDKNGNFIKAWGKRGDSPGEFFTPHTIVVGPDNLLYVGDRDNFRLQIFDLEGNFVAQWKHAGAPWGLYFAGDGTLWMTDGYVNRVLQLDTNGKILGAFGEPGRSIGKFSFPHGIAISNKGEIYVTEILSWRVQKFIPGK